MDQYATRSGRVLHPPVCLIEMVYEVICEADKNNFEEDSDDINKKIVECMYLMKKASLFQMATNTRPVEATKVLREEMTRAIKINIWDLVHAKDLTEEQQKQIIPQMINYLQKYKPYTTFNKIKVRVLARGDRKVYIDESERSVARLETLLR